jgi:heterodisulfide reductase subunit A-like polyferredoxin
MASSPRASLRKIISASSSLASSPSTSSAEHNHKRLLARAISGQADSSIRGSLKGGGDTADVAIIGGGIVGLATAREITNRFPKASVVVVEKEKKLVPHQTSHNRYAGMNKNL